MAVITEQIGKYLERHYSNKGVYILQNETGIEYAEAVDRIPCKYTYKETKKPIESKENK